MTETDERRLQVMLNLPIIRTAEKISGQRPGTLLNPTLGWDRGYVGASLPDTDPTNSDAPVTPEQMKVSTAEVLARMRATGWTIMSASCEVPERDRIAASGRSPQPGQLGADPGLDEWGWSATAYTHVDGVSYWALLSGMAVRKGIGGVSIRLRAPNVDDPPDLFPDRPANLPAGSTCIEQPGVPLVNVEQGTRIEVGARGGPIKAEVDPNR
ncbi:MAG: hypothetical protein ACRD0H_14625 [Actinomycetes bacterium]